MRTIELDGSQWTKETDFYDALLLALGAPGWHGKSINALIDSMIYGGINAIEPPYTVRINNIQKVPDEVRKEIELVSECFNQARQEYYARRSQDIEVKIEIDR